MLDVKARHLVAYAQLMMSYLQHMRFSQIVDELLLVEDERVKYLLYICAFIVAPKESNYAHRLQDITPEQLQWCTEFIKSDTFKVKFQDVCQIDSIPEVSLQEMKVIKVQLIDELNLTPDEVQTLGNACTLMMTWLDAILEFTILKHEVTVLRLQSQKVISKI
jgi:hypothetical protein